MNKKLIRLTESDLHRIVRESINRVLMETDDSSEKLKGSFRKSAEAARNAAKNAASASWAAGASSPSFTSQEEAKKWWERHNK